MANTILTTTKVTREILRVLHEKLSFVGTINRQYDDSYAQTGAKIGDTLKIRLPNQYTVRTGATLSAQDTTESSVSVTMGTQKGVDLNFTSADLTLSLDDFSNRIIEPAAAVLASAIEADVFNVTKDVYNLVGTAGTTPASYLVYGQARQKLNQFLAPKDKNRFIQIASDASAATTDGLKALFNDVDAVSEQYLEGKMGRLAGLNFYENERIYTHTNSAGTTASTVNGASQTGSSITISTTTTAYATGTVVTFAGCFAVHPETKVAYNFLQQFVVQAGSTATSLNISPSIVTSGATQTVSASPTNGGAVTVVGSASTSYPQHLAYHRDAFCFVTADLLMPKGVDMAERESMDGLSIRLVRQYDINNDKFPCRLDVLYGYKTIRPQLACRVTG